MTFIASVTLIVLAGLAAAALARRCSAAVRHWMLTIAVTCACLFPVLALVAPSWNYTFLDAAATATAGGVSAREGRVPVSVEIVTPVEQPEAPVPGLHRDALFHIAAVLWAAGSAVSLLVLFAGLLRLRWLAARARPVSHSLWRETLEAVARQQGLRRPVRLLRSSHPTMLVTWGVFRPRILLPATASQWDVDRIRIVLAHEVAHIVRGDWIVQLAAEALRSAYWFNPFVWMTCGRLRHESERACDDVVLNGGVEGRAYAKHLLDLARAVRDHRRRLHVDVPAPAMVRPGSLERRVRAMLNDKNNRTPTGPLARIGTAAGLLVISIVIAGFAASPQSPGVSGAVLDPHGRGVPGAVVTLIDPRRDPRQQTKTDDSGRFAFAALSPGDYLVEAAVPGFRSARRNITLTKGNVTVDLRLAVGSLTESISIVAAPGTRPAPAAKHSRPQHPYRPIECAASATGGELRPPTKRKNVNPVYPDNPDGSLAGIVVLEGQISADGTVTGTRVLRSPYPELSRAAVEAFEQWEFTPTLLNCVPTEVTVTATFDFSVEK